MKVKQLVTAGTALALTLPALTYGVAADTSTVGSDKVKHVLLLSIDGMHEWIFITAHMGLRERTTAIPIVPILPNWRPPGSTM